MRRPIASRDASWAKATARFLARLGVRPNTVSIASVVFAALAMLCFIATTHSQSRVDHVLLFLGAALFIQLRLLCNLFDGMLAVEFKQGSPLGAIYNDFPDRPADVFILVGCGLVGGNGLTGGSGLAGGLDWLPALGGLAAMLALLTAYTRVLGVAIGAGEYFIGPMAKPHRMAVATVASLVSAVEVVAGWPHYAMAGALLVIVVGCIITTARRLRLIARDLTIAGGESQPTGDTGEDA